MSDIYQPLSEVPGILHSLCMMNNFDLWEATSAVTFNYRYMRGEGFFGQTKRERRAYPAVDL
jgi:hypothetical protein